MKVFNKNEITLDNWKDNIPLDLFKDEKEDIVEFIEYLLIENEKRLQSEN